MRLVLAAAITTAALLSPAAARAQTMGPHPGWYFMPGPTTGPRWRTDGDASWTVGAELSLARLWGGGWWAGGYGDVVRDLQGHATRLGLGPEAGAAFFGMDGGYVVELAGGRARHGLALRPLLTMGVVALYIRVERLFGEDAATVCELGLGIKFPLPWKIDPPPERRLSPPPPRSPLAPRPRE